MAFGAEIALSLNAVVAAAILLTEWQLLAPRPDSLRLPVDLRFVLASQWPDRSCQSPRGGVFLARSGQ